ncbi:dynein regulatory complex subunit 4-like [Salarias fasciatus]|uniref:dynein regulatory complex subunit 4-like n=1 Tax=Salarias fasciatus TaxID=181472 RepID=UPI001176642B|nr:dynein regulatory complex subunit 4-like [Salarias fasciatus]
MPLKQRRSKASSQSSAVVDGLSTKDMSKDQLWEQAILLQEELARVREEKTNFKLERDKNLDLWEISKKSLEGAEVQLRNKGWEKEEAKKHHCQETSTCEKKRKHVQLEQHDAVTKLKLDMATEASGFQNQHNESELELRRHIQDLKTERREKMSHNKMRLSACHVNQENAEKTHRQAQRIMELNKGYEHQMQEMGKISNERMCSLITMEEKKTREELEEVDERMRLRVLEVKKENDQKLQDVYEYQTMVMKVSKLKEEEQQVQKDNERLDRKLSAARQERKRLTDCVRDLQLKGPELQKQLQQLQAEDARSRAHGKSINKEIRDRTVKNELLRQAVEKVQLECDELLRSQQSQMLELQERRTLKEMLLNNKISCLTHTLQRLQMDLREAAGAAAARGGTVPENL